MSRPCVDTTAALTCHNSYQDSEYIGPQAHFTCPHTCVPWENMCRGVSWCQGDHEVCGSVLTCPKYHYENGYYLGLVTRHNINSSAGSAHHYCLSEAHINNRQYDSIDRVDEKNVTTQGSALDIDITSFTPCNGSDNDPGVMCGPEPDWDCRWSGFWCNEASADQCNTGSEQIRTTDSRLCSNPEVWRGVDCSVHFDGRVETYGRRCTGQNMECAYPW